MDAVVNAAEDLGWPAETIHVERFGAAPIKGDEAFEAGCQLSDKTLKVGATEPLLDCLENAGIEIPFACRAGSAATAKWASWPEPSSTATRFYSAAERAEGKKLLACISRGKGSLTLDGYRCNGAHIENMT